MFAFTHADQVRSYTELRGAKRAAQAILGRGEAQELEITNLESGLVAALLTAVDGRHFHPYERIEQPAFSAPSISGFIPAYQRKRIGAVVYRALDHTSWLVLDTRTGGRRQVPTTKAACILTREMRFGLEL